MDENRLIGRDGDLPWRLPNDLAHFKRTTMGKPILMGRKTWESLGRPLPGRRNLVLTRDVGRRAEGADVVSTLDAAALACDSADEIMVIGGAQIYALTLEKASRLFITHVHASIEGDTWFPVLNWDDWQEISRECHPADERNEFPHDFVEYIRKT